VTVWLGFLLVVAAGVLWAAIGVLNSKVSRRNLDFASYAATGVLIGAALMWTTWVRHGVIPQQPYVLPIALICGAAGILAGFGYVALQRAMRSGHHGAVWTVAQSAMALPLLTAMIGWHEALTAAGVIGMGLLFISLVMIGLGKHEKNADSETPGTWFWFALLAFLMFGLSQSINSIPSLQQWPDPARLRPGCYTLGQCCFYVTWMWLRGSRFRRAETLLAVRYAIYGNVSMVLMYRAMDLLAAHQAAGMTLPVGVGTCIVVFALYSVLWLREKAGFFVIGGILVAVAGVGCLTLRGLGW
jgi:drug/metabolite transporter (DMT)-like permease